MAEFGRPIDETMRTGLLKSGLKGAAHRASNCLGWIWRQWLAGTPKTALCKRVEAFVERGLELRALSQSYDGLALHDLYLLHCVIFGSSDAQIKVVAERVADASGDKGKRPLDNGELFTAAWSGMMKYWILGDHDKTVEQSQQIWGAYRERGILAASKSLVIPWIKKDWKVFVEAQKKDFDKLWNRARKDQWTVKAETSTELILTTERYQIEHQWCWAHCGMAILAHRVGVDVATDPFWFPPPAIVPATEHDVPKREGSPDQLDMF